MVMDEGNGQSRRRGLFRPKRAVGRPTGLEQHPEPQSAETPSGGSAPVDATPEQSPGPRRRGAADHVIDVPAVSAPAEDGDAPAEVAPVAHDPVAAHEQAERAADEARVEKPVEPVADAVEPPTSTVIGGLPDAEDKPVQDGGADEIVASDAPATPPVDEESSTIDGARHSADEAGRGTGEPEPAQSSGPSTALLFRAPDLTALPALPRRERDRFVDEDGDDEPQEPSSSRRRSRARRGSRAGAEQPEPRREPAPAPLITEPQRVKGSTRLEAKKQRRRDGRDAGRRRTVVTESEFLARRESVDRTMVVRDSGDRIEIGVLEDRILVEHYVAKSQNMSLIGNVYLGRVQNVLPSMEAAFVDIGRGRNAVLYSGEVDWEAAKDRGGDKGTQARRIELALKSGDTVLVQVTKDPVGHKGARLTSQVSLPGRYLVSVPNGSVSGISRKLPDTERNRLKKILKEVLPEGAGVIVRTAAEGATEEQLKRDVERLTMQWAEISRLVETSQSPALLHSEPDLVTKIIRDVFNEDFQKLVIQGSDARRTIEKYLGAVAPDLLERVEAYDGEGDVFAGHRVTEQIEKALDRKVWLPSGGSLIIDRTEAMTVVDVNTGKFVGSGGNLEETVTKNNLEAAEEIVRQLRLRDIGGIIVVDFIDMVLESNRDLVLRRLVECLSRDRTKHQVAEVTSLGLVQMTRKKIGVGLAESVGEDEQRAEQKPAGEQRRRRGGNGGGQQPQQQQTQQRPQATMHAITEDVKSGLAKIAASTIAAAQAVKSDLGGEQAPSDEARAEESGARAAESRAAESPVVESQPTHEQPVAETPTAEEPAVVAEPEQAEQPTAGEERRPQRAGRRRAGSATTRPREEAPRAEEVDAPQQEAAPSATLLDLPIERREKRPAAGSADDAASLLDSVLGALPEPKQPGQGRSRSRRVSTSALTPKHD